MIVQCTCKHEYQDQQYGVGNRVANHAPKSDTNNTKSYRCTVCSKMHEVRDNQQGKETKKK